MKTVLIVLLAVIGCNAALSEHKNYLNKRGKFDWHKSYRLETNRIPKGPLFPMRPEVVAEPEPQPQPEIDAFLESIMVRGPNGNLQPAYRGPTLRDSVCDECKSIVTRIKTLLDDGAKIDEIKNILLLACDMAGQYKEECKNLVNDIDYLIDNLKPLLDDPQEFCTQLHLCGNSRLTQVNMLIYMIGRQRMLGNEVRANDIVCDECKFALQELKTMLADKDVQDEIKQVLHQICSYFGPESQDCDKLVDDYLPQVLKDIEDELGNPQQVCQELGLCSGGQTLVRAKPIKMPLLRAIPDEERKTKITAFPSGITYLRLNSFMRFLKNLQTSRGVKTWCVICELGLKEIETALSDWNIKSLMEEGLRDFCKVFDSNKDLETDCDNIVQTYFKPMVQMLVDNMSPEKICQEVKACDPHDIRIVASLRGQSRNTQRNEILCEACEVTAGFCRSQLQSPVLQRDIIQWTQDKFCAYLPGSVNDECKQIANQFVPILMSNLEMELDPETFCPEIHLCPGGSEHSDEMKLLNEVPNVIMF